MLYSKHPVRNKPLRKNELLVTEMLLYGVDVREFVHSARFIDPDLYYTSADLFILWSCAEPLDW